MSQPHVRQTKYPRAALLRTGELPKTRYVRTTKKIPSVKALTDAGAEARQEVKDLGGGKLIASVEDADGNVIGLLQSL